MRLYGEHDYVVEVYIGNGNSEFLFLRRDSRNNGTWTRFPPSGRKMILVSGEVKVVRIFAGDHPSESVKVKHPLSLAKI